MDKNLKDPARRRALAHGVALGLGAAGIKSVRAQTADFPNRVIKFVLPFPAGGTLDALGRQVGNRLAPRLGQPIIIESRPGANSQIGAAFVAKAPADGYTLLLGTDASMSVAPALSKSLPYDPRRDFAPVSLLAHASLMLAAHPSIGVSSLADLIAQAKAQPGKLSYASLGIGSLAHITTEALAQRTGMELLHVPYQGIAPAMTALLAGEIKLLFAAITLPLPHIRSGRVRGIALAGPARSPLLPEMPTFAEVGLTDFESRGWFGVLAPRGTPEPIIRTLGREIWSVVSSPEFVETFVKVQGFEATTTPPEQFEAFLRRDQEKWASLVDKLGARVQP